MNAYAYRQVQICIIKYYLLGEIAGIFLSLYAGEEMCARNRLSYI